MEWVPEEGAYPASSWRDLSCQCGMGGPLNSHVPMRQHQAEGFFSGYQQTGLAKSCYTLTSAVKTITRTASSDTAQRVAGT